MLFNFSIQTKHFITKKSKFFKKKMNCFIKILYPNTLLRFGERGLEVKFGYERCGY